jgi:glycosyltransferase involved in cell wall biosynthesis
MPRFAGVRDNNIRVVSDSSFLNEKLSIIEIPEELNSVSSSEIIANYRIRDGKICLKKERKSKKEIKVALVTNWKMKCGIATYSEFLFTEDFKLFIEKNDNPTVIVNDISGHPIPEDKVITCWKRGESTKELVKELKAYDPDVILIQHEFGLWPNARSWISMMNQLSDFRVIVTMHSVFHHKDKTICEAAMPEIVVHLDGAKNVLENEKGIPGKIHVIPHGSFPCLDKSRLWNFYKSDHTLVQIGFGFEYKGYENSVKAVALLKDKYPDIFFTGLFSESPQNMYAHQSYYSKLMELVKELDLYENIGIIRGFQSNQSLDSYLRTNKIALFPYISHPNHEVWGASGAARLAMNKNIPVITSSVNHFSDIPSIKADTPEEMAEQIDKLFSNSKAIENQLNIQEKYLNDTSWKKVSELYLNIFTNV